MIRLISASPPAAGDRLADERKRPADAQPIVLVVDDDRAVREVLCAVLREEGYRVRQADCAEAALRVLSSEPELPLILSDMKMPDHDGMWLLDQIFERHPDAAVVMLTGYGDTESAVACLKRGAADYLLKPPRVTELVRAVERAHSGRELALARTRYHEGLTHLVREKTSELSAALLGIETAYASTLAALVQALDAREHETSHHSQRVVKYTLGIADQMPGPATSADERAQLARGALLHDIGKIGVPDGILLKAGPLTACEWTEMRRHPETGWQILQAIEFLRAPAEIVLAHQERWDGTGYPRKLAREQIPLGARIFAIADTLDAITSDRPYRRASSFPEARAEIARCSGTQFDPACVKAFQKLADADLFELRKI